MSDLKGTEFFNLTNQGANGNNFVNKDHLNNIQSAGQMTSRDTFLCMQGDTEDEYIKVGGLTAVNINIQNEVIPLPEIGSSTWAIITGKTQPFQMQTGAMFINHQTLLGFMNNERRKKFSEILESNKKAIDLSLDLTNKTFSIPRTFYLFMYTTNPGFDGVEDTNQYSELQVMKLSGVKINAYNMSFGQGLVIFENASFTGTAISEDSYVDLIG